MVASIYTRKDNQKWRVVYLDDKPDRPDTTDEFPTKYSGSKKEQLVNELLALEKENKKCKDLVAQ